MAVDSKEMIPVIKKKMWCYSAPDGVLQTRSLQDTKRICREAISYREYRENGDRITYIDYEEAGYILNRVIVTIQQTK